MRGPGSRLAAAALALAGVGGCMPAGPAGARFALGPPPTPVLALARAPQEAALRVRLAPRAPGAARGLSALPAAWDVAVLTLRHPTLPGGARTRTLVRDVDLLPAGGGAYGAAAAFGALRPGTGYQLDVALWEGAAETGALVAAKAQAIALVGGANDVVVALDPLVPPLALTGMLPAVATWGDAVALQGSGLAAGASATLDGTAADVVAAAGPTLDARVPPLAPGTYAWRVRVAGREVRREGFVVEAPPTGAPFALSAVAARQTDPAIASVAAGFVPLWVDDRLSTKVDVLARALDAAGLPAAAEAFVTDAATTTQVRPHLAHDPGRARLLAVWEDGAGAPDVRARFVDAAGQPVGAIFDVAAAAGGQTEPRLAYAPGADAYLVAYRDGNDVVARPVAGGGAVGAAAVLASGGGTTAPDVAHAAASGRHLVVWAVNGQGVRGQLLDGAGVPAGAAFDVAVDPGVPQLEPCVAADAGSGDFMVVWVAQDGVPTVRARTVAAADGALGPVRTVAAGAEAKGLPRLAWAPAHGRFLAAWQAAGDGLDVVGAYLEPDGRPWGPAFAIDAAPGDQARPEVAAQATGALVAYALKLGATRRAMARRVR